MKKINLKVRFRNPAFWLTFLPTVTAFVYTILDIFGIVPSISKDNVVTTITLVISALASLGILVDPTTEGIGDSHRALTYDKPYVENYADDDEDEK